MKKFYISLLLAGFVFQQVQSVSWSDLSLKKIFGTPEHIQEKPLSEKERLQYADDLVDKQEALALKVAAKDNEKRLRAQIEAIHKEIKAHEALSDYVKEQLALEKVIKTDEALSDYFKEQRAFNKLEHLFHNTWIKNKNLLARHINSDIELENRIDFFRRRYEEDQQPKSLLNRLRLRFSPLLRKDDSDQKRMLYEERQWHKDMETVDSLLKKQEDLLLGDYAQKILKKSLSEFK